MSLDDRNAVLEQKLEHNPIDESIASLVAADQRRRRHVRILAISLALDVLLTIGFGYITARTHSLAAQAESNHQSLVRNCETGNEARTKNKQLWTYILSLPPSNDGQASTPEQQRRVDDFKKFLDETFALRDCNNIK